ncbi:hypothetical protein [Streptomyces flavofungini]|uniref:hypothetical protein n=1 Tax=Streptomyces flavofungini TaxID=68200 RepID=UPI0025B17A23|nr:hypothetical protein [Streptomyces flavofungini]WJV50258.1 hypothetical protein QUY26_34960 [Streptomyces flavofungini]
MAATKEGAARAETLRLRMKACGEEARRVRETVAAKSSSYSRITTRTPGLASRAAMAMSRSAPSSPVSTSTLRLWAMRAGEGAGCGRVLHGERDAECVGEGHAAGVRGALDGDHGVLGGAELSEDALPT